MTKRFPVLLISICLLLASLVALPFIPFDAKADTVNGNPTIIMNLAELHKIRSNLNGHYELGADIDASPTSDPTSTYWNGGAGWIPIGTSESRFNGFLDGKGYTITGLFINRTTDNVGLFGTTGHTAEIRNVVLIDVDVKNTGMNTGSLVGLNVGKIENSHSEVSVNGTENVGGLVGYNDGFIENSHSAGEVKGITNVGGLAGNNNDRSDIRNCHSAGTVNGTDNVGGLVGYSYFLGDVYNSYATGDVGGTNNVGGLVGWNHASTVENSYATGNVYGIGDRVGGLVGYNHEGGIIENSYSSGGVIGIDNVGGLVGENHYYSSINNAYSIGNVRGNTNVGGLVGSNYNDLNDCHATGEVDGGERVGGLIGWNIGGTINNSYATGEVDGGDRVGGLMGWNEFGTINNSYSTGDVNGTANRIGGLVGWNQGFIKNSNSTGNVDGTENIGGLVGLNSISMENSYATGDVNGTTNVGGLVGYNDGVIDNSCSTGNINGATNVGGLAGNNNDRSNIRNSHSTGGVNGIDNVGGLVGYSYFLGDVDNSQASGDVSGTNNVGGLVGWNHASTVENSYATGNVYGIGDRVGGLVGYNHEGGIIENSYSTGEVHTVGNRSGGLVGCNNVSSTIRNSHSSGGVNGINEVGGLVGENHDNSIIDNTYSTGNVFGTTRVGGLVGHNHNLGTIANSYSVGEVIGASHVGGLVGSNSATITASFWDIESSGQTTSANGVGKTTAEMRSFSTFHDAGWDIHDGLTDDESYSWWIYDGISYPLHINNYYPAANAGDDQTVDEGDSVIFDGSGSDDNMIIVNYTWTFAYGGASVLLYGESPSFIFNIPGVYVVTLKVIYDSGLFNVDELTVTVLDVTSPIAVAGEDRVVNRGLVQFDGSSSWDNVGIVNHTWTFAYGGGTVVMYGINPSFEFNILGEYLVTLTVKDAAGNAHSDVVGLTVATVTNPIADAGEDIVATAGTSVTFNSSSSTDIRGVTNHTWTFVYGGAVITIYGETPGFIFSIPGTYTVTLTVSNDAGLQDSDTMTVTVEQAANSPEEEMCMSFLAILLVGLFAVPMMIVRMRR